MSSFSFGSAPESMLFSRVNGQVNFASSRKERHSDAEKGLERHLKANDGFGS
ncbi:hypothetical protein Drorol1_Dr00020842, partial [Drosera rotundifolia]